jgi:hypothetical protein
MTDDAQNLQPETDLAGLSTAAKRFRSIDICGGRSNDKR